MNAHQHSLEWAQRVAQQLQEETRALEWRVKTTARLPASGLPPTAASAFIAGSGPNAVQYLPAPSDGAAAGANSSGSNSGGGGATPAAPAARA